MADQSLEILIKTIADAAGIELTTDKMEHLKEMVAGNSEEAVKFRNAFDDLHPELKKHGDTIENLTHNHREMHMILHLLAHETSPAFGAALAGAGAIAGGGIMLAVMAVQMLGAAFAQAQKEADDFEKMMVEMGKDKSLTEMVGSFVDSAEQMAVAADNFERSMVKIREAQDSVEESGKKVLDNLKSQTAELQKLADAKMKQLEVDIKNNSTLTPEQKTIELQKLHARNDAERQALDLKQKQLELVSLTASLSSAQSDLDATAGEVGGARAESETAETEATRGKRNEAQDRARLEKIKEEREKLQKQMDEETEKHGLDTATKLAQFLASSPEARRYRIASEQYGHLGEEEGAINKRLTTVESDESQIARQRAEAAAKAKLADAEERAKSLQKQVEDLKKQVAAKQEEITPTTPAGIAAAATTAETQRTESVTKESESAFEVAKEAENTAGKESPSEKEVHQAIVEHQQSKITPEAVAALKKELAEAQQQAKDLAQAMTTFKDADKVSKDEMAKAFHQLTDHNVQLSKDLKVATDKLGQPTVH